MVPRARLSLATFLDCFLGYFYDLAKGIMGPERAKKYFPVIGTAACFVFFSNALAMVPGSPVPTPPPGVTRLRSRLFIWLTFTGSRRTASLRQALGGPAWYLAPLMFVIESFAHRSPLTWPAIDAEHGGGSPHRRNFAGLIAVFIPLPFMALGVLFSSCNVWYLPCSLRVHWSATEHERC